MKRVRNKLNSDKKEKSTAPTLRTTRRAIIAAPIIAAISGAMATPAASSVNLTKRATSTAAGTNSDMILATPGRGAVVLTVDDAFIRMATIAGYLNERNQKATFCITPDIMTANPSDRYIKDPDVLALHAAGHEIAAHSKTHTNLTTINSAQRAVEFDYPKSYLEALIGEPVTTWAYPFGTGSNGRNLECDKQLYLRYERLLDTAAYTATAIYPRYSDAPPYLIRRTAWSSANHGQIMTAARRAAESAIIVPIFFHTLDEPINPTTTELLDLLDTCQSLGIPLITAKDAFTSSLTLLDPGFEGDLDPSTGQSPWRWFKKGANPSAEYVVEEPYGNFAGIKSLRLSTTDNGYSYVRQQVQVVPGRQYTLSGRAKIVSTGAYLIADKIYAQIQPLSYEQSAISEQKVKTTVGVQTDVGKGWLQFSIDYTASQTATTVNIELVLAGTPGGAVVHFDHIWFAPKYLGNLG